MPWDNNTRFRITTWPSSRLPHPGNLGGFPYLYDEGADALVPDWEAVPTVAAMAEHAGEDTTETYLKLAALDPDDIDAIVEFIIAYGQLDIRGEHTFYGVPGKGAFAYRLDQTGTELDAAYVRASEAVGVGGFSDTLTEIRWAILYMRDLIAARRIVEEQLDPGTYTWQAPFWADMSDLDAPPWTPGGPATTLSLAMSVALAPYSPRIQVFADDDDNEPGSGDITTWTLCCAELFNHISESATYKTCQNERCGRLFVRQEGRAAHGQHRTTGIKYCSWACARAQAQRQYRRRQRQHSAPGSI